VVLVVGTSHLTVRRLPAFSSPPELSYLPEPNSLPRRQVAVLRIKLDIRKLLTFTPTTSGSDMTQAAMILATISTDLSSMDDLPAASEEATSSAWGAAAQRVLDLAGSSSALLSLTGASVVIGFGIAIRL